MDPEIEDSIQEKRKPHLWALSPLLVFLCLYLVTSLMMNDFYKMPLTVAFMASSIFAMCITRGLNLNQKLHMFSQGASNKNILLMIWIFILAGAFAESAKSMGAVDATVNLTLSLLPGKLLLGGLFLAACFVSISVGTSVGTIVALAPVASGIAVKTGVDLSFVLGVVVGGAFFGDNLSFISDTTIAATRTQGCSMRDKFRANILIALPAAIVILLFYIWKGYNLNIVEEVGEVEWLKVIPYIVVITTAMFGVNVATVLLIGILSSGIIGILSHGFEVFGWVGAMGSGIDGMANLIIITLLAGGMLEFIRFNGGVDYIIGKLTKRINGKRRGEFTIAALVSLANICTANNTIAIITIGPLANDISKKFSIDKRKSASILDTFSCVVQGLIPYGAQVLMASGLASVSPLSIVSCLYYPMALGTCALLSIALRFPRKFS